MKIAKTLLNSMVAMSVLMPLAMLSGPVQAQQYSASQYAPRIEGFNVDEAHKLTPGVDLDFTLYGTPGGTATMRIDGAMRNLTLVEIEPGRYEGSYTISSRDKIVARSAVTANLRVGNQVVSAVLSESLQIGVGKHSVKSAPGPQPVIGRFDVVQSRDLSPGDDLQFTVFGTPGGKVDLAINGVKGKIYLPEIKSGEYANSYTIRNRDRIASNSVVTAYLHLGERTTSAMLGKALQNAAAAPPLQADRICVNCGTVETINLVEVNGDGNYLGTIGGGVVGALLGRQVGGGSGRTVAQIAGAVGGAYAGNRIQANISKTTHYEVVVRLQNGATQIVPFTTEPVYRVGDKVQINDGVMVRRP
jgi:outer membrane lipoprotein SlyB